MLVLSDGFTFNEAGRLADLTSVIRCSAVGAATQSPASGSPASGR